MAFVTVQQRYGEYMGTFLKRTALALSVHEVCYAAYFWIQPPKNFQSRYFTLFRASVCHISVSVPKGNLRWSRGVAVIQNNQNAFTECRSAPISLLYGWNRGYTVGGKVNCNLSPPTANAKS